MHLAGGTGEEGRSGAQSEAAGRSPLRGRAAPRCRSLLQKADREEAAAAVDFREHCCVGAEEREAAGSTFTKLALSSPGSSEMGTLSQDSSTMPRCDACTYASLIGCTRADVMLKLEDFYEQPVRQTHRLFVRTSNPSSESSLTQRAWRSWRVTPRGWSSWKRSIRYATFLQLLLCLLWKGSHLLQDLPFFFASALVGLFIFRNRRATESSY